MKNASQDIKDFVELFLPTQTHTLQEWSHDFLNFLAKHKAFNCITTYYIHEDGKRYNWIASIGFQMFENKRRGFSSKGYIAQVIEKKEALYIENTTETQIPARYSSEQISILYIPITSSKQKVIFIFEIAISQNSQSIEALYYFDNLQKLLSHSLEILLEKDILEKNIKNLEAFNVALEVSQEALHENAVKSIKIHEQLKDSIRYAKKMQDAILPDESIFDKIFVEHFVIYEPKDIVSGDFYWFSQKDYTFLAVVDCTGHGVPGAFMSMIGNTLLNEIINVKREDEPARVLEILDKGVQNSLNQKNSHNIDGMDVCLCRFERTEALDLKLTFCGAKRPLYYLRDRVFSKIKGNRRSIGGAFQTKRIMFQNQEMILQKNDILYLSTDGFFDTPNPERQSFGITRFKKIIEENADLTLEEQKHSLLKIMKEYKQDTIQRDDVTLLAVKV